jgi:hypothetical protein
MVFLLFFLSNRHSDVYFYKDDSAYHNIIKSFDGVNDKNYIAKKNKNEQKPFKSESKCKISIMHKHNMHDKDNFIGLDTHKLKNKLKIDIPKIHKKNEKNEKEASRLVISIHQIKKDILELTKCKKDCHICKILEKLNE